MASPMMPLESSARMITLQALAIAFWVTASISAGGSFSAASCSRVTASCS